MGYIIVKIPYEINTIKNILKMGTLQIRAKVVDSFITIKIKTSISLNKDIKFNDTLI
jgi:hypothetical protein